MRYFACLTVLVVIALVLTVDGKISSADAKVSPPSESPSETEKEGEDADALTADSETLVIDPSLDGGLFQTKKQVAHGLPVIQGLIGSPFKLRITTSVLVFFLGIPIGSLVFSAVLFFTYVAFKSSPIDIPITL